MFMNQAESECMIFRGTRSGLSQSQNETRSVSKLKIGTYKLIKLNCFCTVIKNVTFPTLYALHCSCIDYSSFKTSSPNVRSKFLLFRHSYLNLMEKKSNKSFPFSFSFLFVFLFFIKMYFPSRFTCPRFFSLGPHLFTLCGIKIREMKASQNPSNKGLLSHSRSHGGEISVNESYG